MLSVVTDDHQHRVVAITADGRPFHLLDPEAARAFAQGLVLAADAVENGPPAGWQGIAFDAPLEAAIENARHNERASHQ